MRRKEEEGREKEVEGKEEEDEKEAVAYSLALKQLDELQGNPRLVKRLVESSLETDRNRTVRGMVKTKTVLHGSDLQWTAEQNKQEHVNNLSWFTVKESGEQSVVLCVWNPSS